MTPGTGTPDYVASAIRISSTRQHGPRAFVRLPAALLSMSIVLAGCTSPPTAPDTHTKPKSDDAMPKAAWNEPGPPPTVETARGEHSPLPTVESRPSIPTDPTVSVMVDGDSVHMSPEPQPDNDAASDRDTWARIRDGLFLPHPMNPRVMREIDWYGKNPEYLHRMTQRARPYLAYIVREVERRGMPMEFALLPVVESAFRVLAYSRAGASGLWQFIPSTGRLYGLKQNWWYDGRRDVVASTPAALDYLTKLLQDFDGDALLAVAAYNWGEGNVRRAISRNRMRGKRTDVWSLRLPGETRAHVSRLLAIAAIVEKPDRYGVVFESIPDRVYFEQVPLDGQIDLSVAADLAGITLDELRRLNPGFKRWATGPRGPHRLQLPSDAVGRFTAKLAETPAGKRMHWIRHDIVSGDTLGAIARRYGTSVAVLKDVNRLASSQIRTGNHLIVPVSVGTFDVSRLGSAMNVQLDYAAANNAVKTIYHVHSGDSLWRIAHKHGVDMKQLAAWNGLSMTTVLRPSQRLTVYRRIAELSHINSPKPVSELHEASLPAVIHVVEYGDTLSAIAQRHGTTVDELTEFNRINESAILRPGQELRLIPTVYSKIPGNPESIRYRVKRGDSLWDISRRFGVSVASLRQWNQLTKGKPLMPGRELDVHLTRAPAI